jgi:hypothetical protein
MEPDMLDEDDLLPEGSEELTTMAFGEEGEDTGPELTTLALGEEGEDGPDHHGEILELDPWDDLWGDDDDLDPDEVYIEVEPTDCWEVDQLPDAV